MRLQREARARGNDDGPISGGALVLLLLLAIVAWSFLVDNVPFLAALSTWFGG